jgi:hypothetical protein
MNEKLGKILCQYLNAFYASVPIDPFADFDWTGHYASHN